MDNTELKQLCHLVANPYIRRVRVIFVNVKTGENESEFRLLKCETPLVCLVLYDSMSLACGQKKTFAEKGFGKH